MEFPKRVLGFPVPRLKSRRYVYSARKLLGLSRIISAAKSTKFQNSAKAVKMKCSSLEEVVMRYLTELGKAVVFFLMIIAFIFLGFNL
jgi:hypothetical protein